MGGDGIAGELNSQTFNSTIAGFSSLLTVFFDGDYLQDQTTHVSNKGGIAASAQAGSARGRNTLTPAQASEAMRLPGSSL